MVKGPKKSEERSAFKIVVTRPIWIKEGRGLAVGSRWNNFWEKK